MRFAALGLLATIVLGYGHAHAHLLHRQSATMKIVGNTANFVVSVPVSAFSDVDSDGDGLLTPAEIESSNDSIRDQFMAGFGVSDTSNPIERRLTWAVSPETHDRNAPVDYIVIMHRVFFAAVPRKPSVRIELFGTTSPDVQYAFRASCGDQKEKAILGSREREHTFFNTGAPCKSEVIPAGS